MTGRPANTPTKFWGRVDQREPHECWNWQGSVKNGYGRFTMQIREYYAHRYAYELTNGAPPAGHALQVMHKCDNKLCCNPAHLRLGTAAENTGDAYRAGLARAGQRHPKAKFSAELIAAVRADQRPQIELERIYGVSQQHISRIKNGHSRKYEVING